MVKLKVAGTQDYFEADGNKFFYLVQRPELPIVLMGCFPGIKKGIISGMLLHIGTRR
jgi:hypothetical protein